MSIENGSELKSAAELAMEKTSKPKQQEPSELKSSVDLLEEKNDEGEKTKACAKCGKENTMNSKFCAYCGNKYEIVEEKKLDNKEDRSYLQLAKVYDEVKEKLTNRDEKAREENMRQGLNETPSTREEVKKFLDRVDEIKGKTGGNVYSSKDLMRKMDVTLNNLQKINLADKELIKNELARMPRTAGFRDKIYQIYLLEKIKKM
jgi:hypothetical protein